MSLLDDAKKIKMEPRGKRKHKFPDEEVNNLVRSYLTGEISFTQASRVVASGNKNRGGFLQGAIAGAVRRMLKSGELVFVKKK